MNETIYDARLGAGPNRFDEEALDRASSPPDEATEFIEALEERDRVRRELKAKDLLLDEEESDDPPASALFDQPDDEEFEADLWLYTESRRPHWRARLRGEPRVYRREVRARAVVGQGAELDADEIEATLREAHRRGLDVLGVAGEVVFSAFPAEGGEAYMQALRLGIPDACWPDASPTPRPWHQADTRDPRPLTWRGLAHVSERRDGGERGLWPLTAQFEMWEDLAVVPEPLGEDLRAGQHALAALMASNGGAGGGRQRPMGVDATGDDVQRKWQALDLEDDAERLLAGEDVPGWHVAWREATGFKSGRPRLDFDGDDHERLRLEVGVSRAQFDASWKRRDRIARTVAELAERRRVARAVIAYADGGRKQDGRVKLVCGAYDTSRKQLKDMRAELAVGR